MNEEYILRCYQNAKRRARYWSGNPSYSSRVTRETRSSRLSEKYELAMCDCKNWEFEIHRITGKRPKHYDPKAEFNRRWYEVMRSFARGRKGARPCC